ncbi:hypothetical protein [Pseudomonas sp. LT1P18]|uniref:hypothetical protein n=1 Tax=Pseudomonas arabinosi TaxID=3398357 RepID=UPI0039EEA49F
MSTQSSGLPAPALKEVENGVLYLEKLTGDAHAIVPRYSSPGGGDFITLKVDSATGNIWSKAHQVQPGDPDQPYEFSIPKATFEKVLASGANAQLHYVLQRFREDRIQQSQVLSVLVKK